MAVLFGVVFIDLIGFGILMPLLPFYAERLGASPALITLIVASHSLAQFLFAPLWGRLSDRVGRRPVLAVSMLGHAAAYLLLANAGTLWLMLLSRILSGATSANLSTAFAYASDMSGAEERAAALGKVSAAFGLGVATGPILGGLLAGGGDIASANLARPAVFAAGISLLSFLSILVFLPESRTPAPRAAAEVKDGAFAPLMDGAIRAALALVVVVVLCMAMRESILALWANHQLRLSAALLGVVFAYNGAVIATLQFFFIGRLARRFGELRLLQTAIVLLAISWLLLTQVERIEGLLVAMTLSALGTGLFQTTIATVLSRISPEDKRGSTMGLYQSSNSIARFTGQAGAGSLYGGLGVNAPFMIGAAAMVPAFALTLLVAGRLGKR